VGWVGAKFRFRSRLSHVDELMQVYNKRITTVQEQVFLSLVPGFRAKLVFGQGHENAASAPY
jgi:hypothetical protein